MEEKKFLKQKLIQHIFFNIVIFLGFFLMFGLIMFVMIKHTIYANVDKTLYETRMQIVETDRVMRENNRLIPESDILFFRGKFQEYWNQFELGRRINPNIILIYRDANGNLVDNEFGRLSECANEIDFDKKELDKVYEQSIGKMFFYRGINFEITNLSDGVKYVQLLINVDTEKSLVNGYFQIIVSCIVIIGVLSIFASFILSKRTLVPLKESMTKQMEFVQNVSHELRTPLTIIQAKQELLLQEPNSKIIDKSEDIALTLNETKRLSKLVKDLLVLSRADNQKIVLQKEHVNIDEYIKEIISPYVEVAEIEEKNITLNLNYNMDISVDTNKIYQVMIILLDNAIKYTEKDDKIEINTYAKDNKCIIEVKDTGIGVSDEGLKRIFERFYREDRARNRETGGTGLGLSIANMIVKAHNGTIKASHNEPKGTVFTIRLPKN